jgi:TetR/AcrR family transcriptional regulator of autoinduction and epiphytic fitness
LSKVRTLTRVDEVPDGRRERSKRSRAAIIDALLGLMPAATRRPTIEEIAEAAGVSERSVYRHFPDADSLVEAAVNRRVEVMAPLAIVEIEPDEPTEKKVAALIDRMMEFYEASMPLRHIADRILDETDVLADVDDLRRTFLHDQLELLFAPELKSCTGASDRALMLDSLEVVTAWTSWQHLTVDQRLSRDDAAEVMASLAIRAIGEDHISNPG